MGLSGASREVYEEGLQIPIMKLCIRGEMNPPSVRTIRANVRVPDQVLGDIHAQLAAVGPSLLRDLSGADVLGHLLLQRRPKGAANLGWHSFFRRKAITVAIRAPQG
jgi:hypothetical protein